MCSLKSNIMRSSRFTIPACLAIIANFMPLRADDSALRGDLDRAYSAWRAAVATRNLQGWKEHTATFRQVLTRNLIVSQKQPFPQALFDFPLRAPETGTLRFIKAEAKGATASMVYFGSVDVGIPDAGDIPENLLLLSYIGEGGRWKFDTLRLINLASAPDVRASLKNGGGSGVLTDPEFSPSGIVPAVPKLCPQPDHVATLQIMSLGYATRAKVNGFELPVVSDAAEQHLIIGGLRDGENSLELEIKQTRVAEGSARHCNVNAVVFEPRDGKPSVRVFTWHPPGEIAPAFTEQKIIVNKITMRGN